MGNAIKAFLDAEAAEAIGGLSEYLITPNGTTVLRCHMGTEDQFVVRLEDLADVQLPSPPSVG